MGTGSGQKAIKRVCTGLLAHVDSGKTTLSEAMLYLSGGVRRLGRVDHGDAFLDTDQQERDFSAEMERAVQVMDYAVLLISGADGVQGHTETLWKLLERHQVPTFLFVNKMDQPGTDRDSLLAQLRERLSEVERGKPVYVMCQSGLRSYIACRILAGYGYDVYNFSGGFRFYDAVVNDRRMMETSTLCGMDEGT